MNRSIALSLVAAATVLWPAESAAAPSDNSDPSWDIEAYDNCIQNTTKPTWQCCLESGGVPGPASDINTCTAPPVEPVGTPGRATVRQLPPEVINRGDLPALVPAG